MSEKASDLVIIYRDYLGSLHGLETLERGRGIT